MNKKVNKISNLKLIESFVQMNFIKGFKYIDKAGEIINRYQTDTGSVGYNMSPNRLLLANPTQYIKELRISNIDFWCHYVEPNNLGEISRTYQEEAKAVLAITEIKDINRVGWRNYYIYDTRLEKVDFNKLSKLTKGVIQEIQLTLEITKSIKSTIRLKLLKNSLNNNIVILFDVDLFTETSDTLDNGYKLLEDLRNSFKSKALLDVINEILRML